MPELPEVETTRRGIEPLLVGRSIENVTVREARLRWPVALPGDLRGQRVKSVGRRAKYLLLSVDSGHLLVHLGMSGSLRVVPQAAPYLKHDHLALALDDGQSMRLNDPRRFGSVHWHPGPPESHWLLENLASSRWMRASMAPTSRRERAAAAWRSRTSSWTAGSCRRRQHLCKRGALPGRIRPTVAAGRVTGPAYGELAARIRQVLLAAIQMGGTTLRDFVNQDGNPGYFRQSLNVYDRAGEPCPACGIPLTGMRIGQRSTVFCRKCQKAQGFRPPEC